jgi:hypothetical protein
VIESSKTVAFMNVQPDAPKIIPVNNSKMAIFFISNASFPNQIE